MGTKQMFRLILLMSLLAAPVSASVIKTWSGLIGSYTISGRVQFGVAANTSGGFDLIIILENTAAAMPPSTADILTGLYFDIAAATAQGPLGMKSAIANLGTI